MWKRWRMLVPVWKERSYRMGIPYKDFFPPILIKLIKKILRKNRVKYFNSFRDAEDACVLSKDGWQYKEMCQMVGDKTTIYRDAINKPYNIQATYLLLEGALTKFYSEYQKKINILDFGGSCGTVYFDIRPLLGEKIKLEWKVIDLPEMIQSAKKHNLANNELQFFESIENASGNIDIIHTSSTLHYAENAYEIIQKFIDLNPVYILFNRMLFNETENDLFIIHHSAYRGIGPGKIPVGYTDKNIDFPVMIMSFNKFSRILEGQYDLEWKFNVGKDVNGITEKGLLYIKRS